MKNNKFPKIGLALGGGGFRGVPGHIGAIKELEKNKIPTDFIAGSSAGAVVGGIYATTKNIESLEKKYLEMKTKDYLFWFSDVTLNSGLVKGEKALEFLEGIVGQNKISKCKIPFSAVTTNIDTGRPVIIDHGKVSEAIMASSSIPLFLPPRKYGRRWLIDGAASQPVPVETVKKMGADIVVAINVFSKVNKMSRKKTDKGITFPKFHMVDHSISIFLYNLAKYNCKSADIVISPDLYEYGWLNMNEYLGKEDPIVAGKQAAKKAIPHIKEKIEKWMKSRE